jgi:phage terminase Nu1 subunit (DNA packaging protein)
VLVSVEQLAGEFQRTPRYVQQLAKAGMPKAAHGQYDLELCKSWYIGFLQRKISQREGDVDDNGDEREGTYNVDREQARLTRAKADIAEIELTERRGEVIPIKVFEDTLGRMVTQARQQLLQLPGRAAPVLEGEPRAVIKSKLTTLIHAALKSLSTDSDEHSTKSES